MPAVVGVSVSSGLDFNNIAFVYLDASILAYLKQRLAVFNVQLAKDLDGIESICCSPFIRFLGICFNVLFVGVVVFAFVTDDALYCL